MGNVRGKTVELLVKIKSKGNMSNAEWKIVYLGLEKIGEGEVGDIARVGEVEWKVDTIRSHMSKMGN